MERLNAHSEYFRRIQSIRPRLKAIFGTNTTSALDEIFKIRNEILIASRMLSEYVLDGLDNSPTERAEYRESRESHKQTKWKGMETPDQVDERVAKAKAALEERLEPLLKSRYRE